jgi:hypothetical protein
MIEKDKTTGDVSLLVIVGCLRGIRREASQSLHAPIPSPKLGREKLGEQAEAAWLGCFKQ